MTIAPAQGSLPKTHAIVPLDATIADDVRDDLSRLMENLDYVIENTWAGDGFGLPNEALIAYRKQLQRSFEEPTAPAVESRVDVNELGRVAEKVNNAYLLSRDLRNRVFLRVRRKDTQGPAEIATAAGSVAKRERLIDLRRRKVANKQATALEMFLGKSETKAQPVMLTIEPTSMCNFACVMCPQGVYGLRPGFTEITNGQIASLATAFPTLDLLHCQIVGEPTTSKQLGNITDRAIAAGVKVAMVTNGSMLHTTNADIANFHHITFSFDGATAKTFEAQRAGGNFGIVVENIRAARARCPDTLFEFNVVLTKLNLDELPAIVRLAKELGVPVIQVRPLNIRQRPLLLKAPEHAHLDMMALRTEDLALVMSRIAEATALGCELGVTVVNYIEDDGLDGEAGQVASTSSLDEELHHIERKRSEGAVAEIATKLMAIDINSQAVIRSIAGRSKEAEPQDNLPIISVPDDSHDVVEHYYEEIRLNRPARFSLAYCGVPWIAGIVHASGSLVPCCYLGTNSMGKVTDNGFADVWNGPKLKSFRQSMYEVKGLPPACVSCNGGDRYVHLVDMLQLAARLGYRWDEIDWPANYSPPRQIAAAVEKVRRDLFDAREPDYVLGQEMEVSDDKSSKHLRYGFKARHNGGCWTDGYESILVFRPSQPIPESLELRLRARAFVDAERHPIQRVRVELNGNTAAEWKFDRPGAQQFTARFDNCVPDKDGLLKVTLHLLDAVSQRDLGLGPLTPVAAIFIKSFELSPAPAPVKPAFWRRALPFGG